MHLPVSALHRYGAQLFGGWLRSSGCEESESAEQVVSATTHRAVFVSQTLSPVQSASDAHAVLQPATPHA